MKYHLIALTLLAACMAPAQDLKTLTPITGANISDADYLPLIDVSANGLKGATIPEIGKKLGIGGLDPRTIPGMVAGYNIANTTRTGAAVDSWLDISGNGRTAVAGATKSTIGGTGADEYAYLGDPYTVAAEIPVNSQSLTIVAIYKGGRIPYQYRAENSTLAMNSGPATGMLYAAGAAQFYNPVAQAGVSFEAGAGNCVAMRFGAGQRSHTVNGLTWTATANAASTAPFTQIFGGFTGAFNWQLERVALYFYNRPLSDYEIAAIQKYHNVATASSALIPVTDSFGVGFTAGTTDLGYVRRVESSLALPVVGLATRQGIETAAVITNFQTGVTNAITQLVAKGIVPTVYFDVGKNDIANNVSVATLQANYATLIGAWTAAGANVIASTLPPRNAGFSGGVDAAIYETRRGTFNTWLRTQSSLWTRLADIAADARVGDVADLSGTNYSDGMHPTAAGHAIYAELIIAKINSL